MKELNLASERIVILQAKEWYSYRRKNGNLAEWSLKQTEYGQAVNVITQIEHSRHRSFNNFIANALGAIAAYCSFEKSPPLNWYLSMTGNLHCSEIISNSR